MTTSRSFATLRAAAAVLLIVVCAAVLHARRRAPAAGPPEVAPPAIPARMVRAGPTVYWTVNRGAEHLVFAMTPPARPQLLHREYGGVVFGALAGGPRVVLAVDEPAAGLSRIVRLSGAARTLAVVPRIGSRDLLADGSWLVWADDLGVRAMPATGGPVRMPARAAEVGELALSAGRVYFVTGRTVRSVALAGGPERVEIRAANNITGLCVADRIYWSELGVTVRSPGRIHWTALRGHATTALGCAGSGLAWSDCRSAHPDCQVLIRSADGLGGFTAGSPPADLSYDGHTVAYLTSGGPRITGADPSWVYQPVPAPARRSGAG